MDNIFHNTICLTGESLKEAIEKLKGQNKMILNVFNSNPDLLLTPFDVHDKIGRLTCPITSVRRSINYLTRTGFLIKTETQKLGLYKTLNNCWKLNPTINKVA